MSVSYSKKEKRLLVLQIGGYKNMSPFGVEIYIGPHRRGSEHDGATEEIIEQAQKRAGTWGMLYKSNNRTFKGDYVIPGFLDHEEAEVDRIAAEINKIEDLSAKVVQYEFNNDENK